ncbi:hypothetical protein SRABI106_03655 [Rahnella aquatilis]|nr:hypothetical protein SRABI106_03655 [Rahnella aquatilis]
MRLTLYQRLLRDIGADHAKAGAPLTGIDLRLIITGFLIVSQIVGIQLAQTGGCCRIIFQRNLHFCTGQLLFDGLGCRQILRHFSQLFRRLRRFAFAYQGTHCKQLPVSLVIITALLRLLQIIVRAAGRCTLDTFCRCLRRLT